MSHDLARLHLSRADESLKAAEELLRDGLYRDAVGRAYYAMFHAAQALLVTKGLEPRTHRGMVRQFGEHFVKTGDVPKRLWDDLIKAKEYRESGDYDVGFSVDERDASSIVEEAAGFVDWCGGMV